MPDLAKLRERMRSRIPKASTRAAWYSISNQAGSGDGTAVIRIYDEISWFGISAEDFVRELDDITATSMRVEINSPGGDVFDAIAIYNALRTHPAHVTTRVDGIAASAASLIVQAGDHRVMLSASQMMIHNAWGLAIGNADDHRELAALLDQQDDIIAGIYAARSGGDRENFRTLMAAETWLSDSAAIEAGLADEVIDPPRQDGPKDYAGPSLHDQISEAMDVVSGVLKSAERVDALRAEQGKALSQRNRAGLDELAGATERLRALLTTEEDDNPDELRREYAKFVALTQEL